jgi:hypothetical protein
MIMMIMMMMRVDASYVLAFLLRSHTITVRDQSSYVRNQEA